MAEAELVNKYSDEVKECVPYIILTTLFFNARNGFQKMRINIVCAKLEM